MRVVFKWVVGQVINMVQCASPNFHKVDLRISFEDLLPHICLNFDFFVGGLGLIDNGCLDFLSSFGCVLRLIAHSHKSAKEFLWSFMGNQESTVEGPQRSSELRH